MEFPLHCLLAIQTQVLFEIIVNLELVRFIFRIVKVIIGTISLEDYT